MIIKDLELLFMLYSVQHLCERHTHDIIKKHYLA